MICKPREYFQCSSSQCIPWSNVCDGVANCDNKADEVCDMCTNDIYKCKDNLSVINCSMACSTLGYIPCQNYMDEKVCASFLRRQAIQTDGFFHFGSLSGKSLINSLSSQSIFISVLGFFGAVLILIFLIIISVHFKRSKLAKQRRKLIHDSRTGGHNRSLSNTSSDNSLEDYHYPHLIEDSSNSFNKPNNIYSKPNQLKDESTLIEHKSNESISARNSKKVDTVNLSRQLSNLDNHSLELPESHVYGEAPPSYKQAKYFPKANLSKDNNLLINQEKISSSQTIEVNESHVYENLEDVLDKSSTCYNKQCSQQRRAKFQGLKKNSKRNSSITESSTESINVMISKKNLSSPINEIAD